MLGQDPFKESNCIKYSIKNKKNAFLKVFYLKKKNNNLEKFYIRQRLRTFIKECCIWDQDS